MTKTESKLLMPKSLCSQWFFQTIKAQFGYLVHFLCAAQVNYNDQVSEVMLKVIRLSMPVLKQTN
ncbi:hypothetical protein [Candidatus Enterovibrio escicola]|uniref:hypothetical protein n=1 Tax=Candidatus Enterovibrio escicola TaxID=1927127 RepID=UPI0011BA7062|nr:hypothetical protein [Candidatus Enterovibrio escacola]